MTGGSAPRPLGATVVGPHTEFRVWAPRAKRVDVLLANSGRLTRLDPEGDGVFAGAMEAPEGTDYYYRLDGIVRPDPRSRHQPQGVHGPSRVVDPSRFEWTDAGWTSGPRESLVFYELHVGTFTPQGSFDAIVEKLPHLADLGITALELMPICEFPGARNWGYDGVFPFAPHSAYGGPDGLWRLVDACHRANVALFVDSVFNHLGPEGNCTAEFAPYFTTSYKTPWGSAFAFEGDRGAEVRRYVLDAARAWIRDYHVDGLRLDAVHTMFDASNEHIVQAIGTECRRLGAETGRRIWVVAESDLNDPKVVRPEALGAWNLDAQWSDDFHHALYAAVTGHNPAHLSDFGTLGDLAKAMTDGFVFDGRYSPHRGRYHGAPALDTSGERFVVFAQNHDQIANVSAGRRLSELVSFELEKSVAMILCFAPYLVLLFQGQEYGERAPFHYFTSHGDADLVERVRHARRAEYAAVVERHNRPFADPQDEATFAASKLRWESLDGDRERELFDLYRTLLSLRRQVACLGNCRRDLMRTTADDLERWLVAERHDPGGSSAILCVNLSDCDRSVMLPYDVAHYPLRLSTLEPNRLTPASNPSALGPSPPKGVEAQEPALELRPWEAVLLVDAALDPDRTRDAK
jgi:maltooligosyltrehalose trehalohydrolase